MGTIRSLFMSWHVEAAAISRRAKMDCAFIMRTVDVNFAIPWSWVLLLLRIRKCFVVSVDWTRMLFAQNADGIMGVTGRFELFYQINRREDPLKHVNAISRIWPSLLPQVDHNDWWHLRLFERI